MSLFIIFDSMDFRCKVINYYAGYMFPLYLFHDNEYMRELLWIRLFKNRDFGYSKLIIVHIAICVIVILLMSFGIEFGRKKLFEFGKKTIGKCMVKDEGK